MSDCYVINFSIESNYHNKKIYKFCLKKQYQIIEESEEDMALFILLVF